MQIGQRATRMALALGAGIAVVALSACGGAAAGSGSGTTGASASQLLKDTFSGPYTLTSGALDVELIVAPSGSSTLTGPITLSFGGPFANSGAARPTLPVTGRVSTALGGLTSAVLSLDIVYRDLGQPQSITAPTAVKPYSPFQTQVKTLTALIRGAVSSGVPQASASASGSASSNASDATSSAYNQCLAPTNGDYTKMYKCAGLVGSGP